MSALFTEIYETNTKEELASLVCDVFNLMSDFVTALEINGDQSYTEYRHDMVRLKYKIANSGKNP